MTKNLLSFITGRVVAKVMFLHVSVILLTGGGVSGQGEPPRTRQTPPGPGRPPGTRQTPPGPGRPTPSPPGTRQTPRTRQTPPDQADPPRPGRPPSPGSRLQNTVYEQPVRILLECILVASICFHLF